MNVTVGSNSSSGEQLPESATIRGIKATAYLILLLMSVMGNSLVIAVVHRKRELRTTINYLIANMAVSDVLFPLVTIPLDLYWLISGHTNEWLLEGGIGEFCCKFIYFTTDVSIAVSILTMLVIASERFRAAVFPLRSALVPEGRCAVIIAIIWLVSAILYSPNLYRFQLRVGDTNVLQCGTHWGSLNAFQGDRIMWMITFIGLIILPSLILSVLYLKIFLALRKQNCSILRLGSATNCDRRRKKSQKLNSMLLVVVVVFFITWIPFSLYYTLLLYYKASLSAQLSWGLFFLTRTYQAINPVVYYVFNKAYRHGIENILGCSTKYEKPSEQRSRLTSNTTVRSMKMHIIHNEEEEETRDI